jgi:enolase
MKGRAVQINANVGGKRIMSRIHVFDFYNRKETTNSFHENLTQQITVFKKFKQIIKKEEMKDEIMKLLFRQKLKTLDLATFHIRLI